jgi:hypothetical protein
MYKFRKFAGIPGCLEPRALAQRPTNPGIPRVSATLNVNLPNVAASDWRAAAEARGRAAFENAVELQTTAEPLAWLWGGQRGRDDTTAPPIRAAKGLR